MKTHLIIIITLAAMLSTACSSAAADAQAQATLERQRQLTAQAAADSQRQADMLAMLQTQAQQNQQAQIAAQAAQVRADAAFAAAAQAQANALNAVATSAGDGVRIPTNVALVGLLLLAIVALLLGRWRAGAPAAPARQVLRLLPNPDDQQFNRLLTAKGGYWGRDGRAYTPDGAPVVALLNVLDEEDEWMRHEQK